MEERFEIKKGKPGEPTAPGIILGQELAKNIGVMKGDTIYLISSRGMLSPIGHIPDMKRFKVTDFFKSGMYEYDGSLAYIHLVDAQNLQKMGDTVTGIEIRVKDIYKAKKIGEEIIDDLGFPYWVRDWMQMNKNLFSALKLEKTVMFIILTLIILVAAFNIARTWDLLLSPASRGPARGRVHPGGRAPPTMSATDSEGTGEGQCLPASASRWYRLARQGLPAGARS